MTGKQKPKTPIEREENEDLEVDEGLPESGPSKAEEGLAETPEKTGGEPKVVRRKSANDVDLPWKFHPVAFRASGSFMPVGAG